MSFFKKLANKAIDKVTPDVVKQIIEKVNPPKEIHEEFFPAWYEKYPGVKNVIKAAKAKKKPYHGMKEKEIIEYLKSKNQRSLYEVQKMTVNDLMFIAEPTNKYNPKAIKIISEQYGTVGYICDDDLDRFHALQKKYPRGSFSLVVSGGNKMVLMDGELYLDKNNPYVRVYFDYSEA